MSETDVFIKEAVAVAERAMADGVARLKLSRQELTDKMIGDGCIKDSAGTYR